MSNAEIRGRFVWHELMTTDTGAASGFYSRVVPWKTQDSGMPSYTLWMSGKNRAGGLMALPDDASGTPPHWIIYIGTPDVDATVAAAEKIGGKVLKGASDIPTVGRFAVLSDPQGAAFAVFFFFENFLNVGTYMADARAQELPLVNVGGGEGIHDWAYMFAKFGLINHDITIGHVTRALGWLGMLAVVAWLAWRGTRPAAPER